MLVRRVPLKDLTNVLKRKLLTQLSRMKIVVVCTVSEGLASIYSPAVSRTDGGEKQREEQRRPERRTPCVIAVSKTSLSISNGRTPICQRAYDV